MSALGWPSSGQTVFGLGDSLRPHSHISANKLGIRRESYFEPWIDTVFASDLPNVEQVAGEMKKAFETAQYFPGELVADLSGGKDSRVLAAAAISSGFTNHVRTVNTDSGEVETARKLVELSPFEIKHTIIESASARKSKKQYSFEKRMLDWARNSEGYYLAPSAIRAESPKTSVRLAPRINGLGGEAVQGGNLAAGIWKDRFLNAGREMTHKRLEALATRFTFITPETRDSVFNQLLRHVEDAQKFGLNSAQSHMDFIYLREMMPNWSLPFSNRHTILPFFAPSLLEYSIKSLRQPLPYGSIHKDFLRTLLPNWIQVPFYKGTPQTRKDPFLWELSGWEQTRQEALVAAESTPLIDQQEFIRILDGKVNRLPDKNRQLVIARTFMDSSLRIRAQEVGVECRETLRALGRLGL